MLDLMDDPFAEQMRSFIMATEPLNRPEPELLVESDEPAPQTSVLEELEDIVFRLRAFMESSNGDYALGVEIGMQRAADMIENVIKRHGG